MASSIRENMINNPELQIIKISDSNYEFIGAITESLDPNSQSLFKENEIHLNLSKVSRLTSSGILKFMQLLGQLNSSSNVYYHEVPSFIVLQMGMVKGLVSKKNRIVSFYAPYVNRNTDEQRDVLLKLEDIILEKLPPIKDPETKELLVHDTNEQRFLRFISLMNT